MPSTWTKASAKPRDTGLYRNEAGTVRVLYQAVETKDGKTAHVQRAASFPRGEYRLTAADGTASRVVDALTYARAWKAAKDAERGAGRVHNRQAEEVTVGEYYARWASRPADKTGQLRRPTTMRLIDTAWRVYLAPTFADQPVRAVTLSIVRDWFARLECGPGARCKALRTLSSIMRAAEAEGLRVGNPTAGLRVKDGTRTLTRAEVFTDEEYARLRAEMPDRYKLLLDFLSLGLRIGEASGLHREDVSLRGDVRIVRTLTETNGKMLEGPPKTSNGYRTLPLRHLATAMQQHVALYSEATPDGLVFTLPNGGPIRPGNWRVQYWYPALQRAGLPRVVPHALRHRVVCQLADQGYSDSQIAGWVGDTAATVATVYRNVLVHTNDNIAAALAASAVGSLA